MSLSLEQADSNAKIIVSDRGKGIPAEFLPFVFFRQHDEGTSRTHGGLGLGLALVRHLVELHGGSVEASSEGEGMGSTLTIALPLLAGSARDVPVKPRSEPLPAFPSLSGRSILVVDDEPDARLMVTRVLENCGCRVSIAAAAAVALELLDQHRPDLVITDIAMPEEDGYSLLAKVRSRFESLPVIALTAHAGISERDDGFTARVTKPVDPIDLANLIASII